MDPEESFRAYVSGRIAALSRAAHHVQRVQVLLDPPDGVRAMDVARHLMEAGRFGATAPDPRPFPARPLVLLPAVPVLLVVGGVAGAVRWWRRRRAVSR
ncbi:hypothetical protein ABZ793_08215 [Micromonospora sp. NPDC047465]|uniref:hypothetical protein n=1 Tax=Micromonospora sp. NPDC047465 TaxID=3154813 RepID=UPI003408088D